MAKVAVGKKVPAFTAQATSETQVSPKSLLGKKFVIYFYPKDNTPGCTTEGQDFAANHAKFKRQKCAVFGVSRDSLASHEKFKAKYKFPFELISDPDERLCKLFDVIKEKNMYGRKVLGIERSTFLINEKGVLVEEWRKVRVKGHVDAVIAAAKSAGS